MKLRDFGSNAAREWFQQVLEWSKKRVSVDENLDIQIIEADIGTSETRVGHSLGRIPKGIIPIMKYPNGVSSLSFTKESTADSIFLSRASAGKQALIIY